MSRAGPSRVWGSFPTTPRRQDHLVTKKPLLSAPACHQRRLTATNSDKFLNSDPDFSLTSDEKVVSRRIVYGP